MPILKCGILKGRTVPLSGETVERSVVSASSSLLGGAMEVGREIRRYSVLLDIFERRRPWRGVEEEEGEEALEGVWRAGYGK